MKKLITATMALSLYALPALAAEPTDCSTLEGDAKAQCEEAAAAAAKALADAKAALEDLGDCSDKEGDAKAECEKTKAELEATVAGAKSEPAAAKGGKAKKSDTNRMEVVNEDE